MRHPTAQPKWVQPEVSTSSRLTREMTFERITSNLEGIEGSTWSEVVNKRWADLLSKEDVEELDRAIFERFREEESRKYYAGCEVALVEKPDRYEYRAQEVGLLDPSELPSGAVGDGQNVFQSGDITGTALLVREVGRVNQLIDDGVPDGAIAVIDDAGGTMTAAVLPEFKGVVCLAGTVRSHLAIIAREYGVPTLMGVRLTRPLEEGETITVSYSAAPHKVDVYLQDEQAARALIHAREESA